MIDAAGLFDAAWHVGRGLVPCQTIKSEGGQRREAAEVEIFDGIECFQTLLAAFHR